MPLLRVCQDSLQSPLEHSLHRRHAAGIAAAHHDHVRVLDQGIAKVVHQADDPGIGGESRTECG